MNPYSEAVQLNLMKDEPDNALFLNEGRRSGKTHFAKQMLEDGRSFVITTYTQCYRGLSRVCRPSEIEKGILRGQDIDFVIFDEVPFDVALFRLLQRELFNRDITVVFLGAIHA